jgi:hypothetical protein
MILPHEISLVAVQKGDSFVPYVAKNGNTLLLVQDGLRSAQEMFASAKRANTLITWLLRLLGFLLMFIGVKMFFAPLVVLADVVPFLGKIGNIGTSLVAGVVAGVCAVVTIAVAWIAYRPVLGVLLLAVAVALIVLFMKKAAAAKAGAAA